MNELRRMAYLEALGVDCFVSRRQLPGAAVSRRLTIVTKPRTNIAVSAEVPALPVISVPVPHQDSGEKIVSPTRVTRSPALHVPQPEALNAIPAPRFSLITIVAGDWLWLEDLGDMPLTTEQVQLVQAMAHALSRCRGGACEAAPAAGRPDVLQFDWPMHNNYQLDLGEDAARAGIAAFIDRRLEQYNCRGVVLLGQACVKRVLPLSIELITVSTASSAELLQTPARKRQVWLDLQPLVCAP